MNTINNSRFMKTKNSLRETMLTLMAEGRSVNTISVKELCEKCGINRSTFYAHYSIVRDIAEEIETNTLDNTRKYMSSMTGNEYENTTLLLSYIRENQVTFRILLNAKDSNFSERLISQSFPIFHRIELVPFPKHLFDYIKAYAIDGNKAVILSWINNGCREDAEQISDLIIALSKRVIDTAFTQIK